MQKYLKRVLLLSVLLLITIFLTACGEEAQKIIESKQTQVDGNQCTKCHEMKPEVLTWEFSSHNKFSCTTCHKADPSDYQQQHDNQSFIKPIKIAETVPDSVCLDCHSNNRKTSASGDLIIPHKRHADTDVSCVACHNGVVHAKIAERGLTASGNLSDYNNWNKEKVKKIATSYYRLPNMWDCIDCHKQVGASRQCGACHTTIPNLPSHDQSTWKRDHGKVARRSINECTNCHVSPGTTTTMTSSTGDKAADFAQSQQFCNKCHLQRPEMHEESMLSIHPEKVAQRGGRNCLTCHNREEPKPNSKVAATFCNQCHWSKN